MYRALSALALAVALAVPAAQAQSGANHPIFQDGWLFRLGANRADADARLGLSNEQTGNIPLLDLDALGVDPTTTSIWANVIWQSPERWHWSFTYFESKADGSRLTEEDFRFGALEIPAGTGTATEFKTRFFILNGSYDFFDRPNQVAGVGFGLYSLDLDASLQTVNNNEPRGEAETADTLAPLPTVSLYYRRAFNDKWAIMADLGHFSANYDKYDGDIVTGRLTVDYWFNEHWGVGGGYSLVDVDLDVDEIRYDERYDVNWSSFFLYLTAGF